LVEEQEVSDIFSYLSPTVALISLIQARYFGQILKEAGLLEVMMLMISDGNLATLTSHYEVRNLDIVSI
jgi:hypothetical protein